MTDTAGTTGFPDDTDLLVKRLSEGDEIALEILLERHLPSLRAFVRGKLGAELRSLESASDLVQSTCREVLRNRERFQHPGPDAFRHWLFTTASRKVSNRLRERHAMKRDAGPEVRVGSSEEVSESRLLAVYGRFSSPSHRLGIQDEIARVERALDNLPEDHREVVLLAHVAELSRAEIAGRLGKTEVAVRSILHRALSRIAADLDTGE